MRTLKTKLKRMTYSQTVDKIVEPGIIYLGALAHYLFQSKGLIKVETGVNILVGVGVVVYTCLKIIQIWRQIRGGDEGITEQIRSEIEEYMSETEKNKEN